MGHFLGRDAAARLEECVFILERAQLPFADAEVAVHEFVEGFGGHASGGDVVVVALCGVVGWFFFKKYGCILRCSPIGIQRIVECRCLAGLDTECTLCQQSVCRWRGSGLQRTW